MMFSSPHFGATSSAAALALVLFSAIDAIHAAEVEVSDRTALLQALQQATPGTIIRVAPGTYRGGISASGLKGEAGKSIVIMAADDKQPPVFEGGGGGIHLSGCSHVELRDLHVNGATGNGVNVDDAGNRDTPVRGIVLRRLTVTNIGSKGNQDGIKMSGVDGFTIVGCRVERWGGGGSAIDFVGCHEGVVENCVFSHHAGGASAGANAVQSKGGSRAIVIRRCQFIHAGGRAVNVGGSTGLEYMRPANPGCEAKDITVEDCYFTGSAAPVAFVGVDGAVFQRNTIYRPTRWVLRILQENQDAAYAPCRNGVFRENLIVFHATDLSTTVNVGGGTEPQTFKFEKNAWYCVDNPARTQSFVRLPVAEVDGVYDKDPMLKDPAAGDLTKGKDSPLKKYGVSER
ncbi:parallel beta helix pectate lyase-like protein [Roseimicrobium gellanilyticum]|uniref:Parallel beta helix pectate lyase-like protein n=1 Tax=Roseimicrobium gellanilyticum TaxID=748857 RepID=A0A366H5W8_9BACT|nr:right-handed parallel beta-helix repeat-containing protein [Roseimicrobium gellanilyticum]RBP37322.1 parallel beta helix pectate lyase-like protein [Roseimicrobium gellanilyticum]